MTLRSFVRLRSLLFVALFLGIGFISWGCASVGSPFATSQTAQGVKVSVTPASASVPVSGTKKFTASVVNTSNPAVIWQVNGTTGGEPTHGTIDATGLYTAPPAVPSPSVVTIAAVLQAEPTKIATAQALISQQETVAVSPSNVFVQVGHAQTLTATLQYDYQNKGVTWTLTGAGCSGSACGSLSTTSFATVVYVAPKKAPSPATVIATATATADSTKTSAATITITNTATAPTPPATRCPPPAR